MGITIEGPHKSIDMGYGGFAQLRETVAELTAPDISEHYNYLLKNGFLMSKSDFKKYDAKTEELDRKYGGKFTGILNFLYAADAGASVSADICKSIYDIVCDYDDDIAYGYIGRSDCARFADFKEILLDCIENNSDMEWY
ncbi:hypothetical protein [Frisingicoccus sp.]|mgnify:CR=1 FL=1|uniref:hypothetical protein n=1 Tax=Frisingicoccus sp. TaxID=1918627 RepID=UPI00399A6E45